MFAVKDHVRCMGCDGEVRDAGGHPRIPCERCGSTGRVMEASIVESVNAEVRIGVGLKRPGGTGKHKWALELKDAWERHRASGEWRHVFRSVDRGNERYLERITDDHGKIHRDIDEPLSEHRGRGDAQLMRKN